jgi:hypothetical protein
MAMSSEGKGQGLRRRGIQREELDEMLRPEFD